MPKYLWKVSYSVEGLRGLMREGAQSRATFIEQMTAANGGALESFYFSFGDTDVYVIADLPGDTTAAAISMAVASAGVGSVETVKLLTPAEIDEARGIQTGYRPPGA